MLMQFSEPRLRRDRLATVLPVSVPEGGAAPARPEIKVPGRTSARRPCLFGINAQCVARPAAPARAVWGRTAFFGSHNKSFRCMGSVRIDGVARARPCLIWGAASACHTLATCATLVMNPHARQLTKDDKRAEKADAEAFGPDRWPERTQNKMMDEWCCVRVDAVQRSQHGRAGDVSLKGQCELQVWNAGMSRAGMLPATHAETPKLATQDLCSGFA